MGAGVLAKVLSSAPPLTGRMHDSFVAVLSSGSCGNSTLIASHESAVLIDAGISCREIERRLSLFGKDPDDIRAVLLTHEHTDHNRGARRFCRIHGVPLFGTAGTLSMTPHDDAETTTVRGGNDFSVGDIEFRPFPVRHLAAEPIAYSAKTGNRKVSIASDLGSLTDDVVREMSGSDLVMIEANYDDDMLMNGRYPEFLKRAIAGDHGHLSNVDAGRLCAKAASERTKRVVLLHLSRDNNTSDLAGGAVGEKLRRRFPATEILPTEHGSRNGPFRL